MALGVYVHFPYCVRRCPYCDFAVTVADEVPHARYADAVLRELAHRLEDGAWAGRETVSLYFGGGTPSLWDPRCVERVIEGVDRALGLGAGAEITVEANPGGESATLAALARAGANRVSFGTQSFQGRFLSALGRWHTEADSFAAVDSARAAGFSSVSVDLIFAAPGQDAVAVAEDARRAASTGPDHVSAYCLTLAPKVPMARDVAAGRVVLPEEDAAVAMEDALLETLGAAGYERYEISSHARPGHRAVHNTLYWTGGEYLALGASASGFFRTGEGGVRYRNVRSAEGYLARVEGGADPEGERESLDPSTLLSERLFSGLRLAAGVDLDELGRALGLDPRSRFGPVFDRLVAAGLLARDGARLFPTARGLRFHDTVAVELV